jgi:hypothetical protein
MSNINPISLACGCDKGNHHTPKFNFPKNVILNFLNSALFFFNIQCILYQAIIPNWNKIQPTAKNSLSPERDDEKNLYPTIIFYNFTVRGEHKSQKYMHAHIHVHMYHDNSIQFKSYVLNVGKNFKVKHLGKLMQHGQHFVCHLSITKPSTTHISNNINIVPLISCANFTL